MLGNGAEFSDKCLTGLSLDRTSTLCHHTVSSSPRTLTTSVTVLTQLSLSLEMNLPVTRFWAV